MYIETMVVCAYCKGHCIQREARSQRIRSVGKNYYTEYFCDGECESKWIERLRKLDSNIKQYRKEVIINEGTSMPQL